MLDRAPVIEPWRADIYIRTELSLVVFMTAGHCRHQKWHSVRSFDVAWNQAFQFGSRNAYTHETIYISGWQARRTWSLILRFISALEIFFISAQMAPGLICQLIIRVAGLVMRRRCWLSVSLVGTMISMRSVAARHTINAALILAKCDSIEKWFFNGLITAKSETHRWWKWASASSLVGASFSSPAKYHLKWRLHKPIDQVDHAT